MKRAGISRLVSPWRVGRPILVLPGTLTVLVPALLIVDDRPRLGWGLEGIVGPVIVFVGLALNCA